MDSKELKELLATALQTVVADVKSEIKTEVGSLRTELNSKIEKLETAKAAVAPEVKPEVKADSNNSMKVSDFGKLIGDAVKEAVKPLTDSMAAQKTEKTGVRRSISGGDIEFYGKFSDKKEGDPLEVADIQQKIDEIAASNLSPTQKAKKLEPLSAQKRYMLKEQYRQGS